MKAGLIVLVIGVLSDVLIWHVPGDYLLVYWVVNSAGSRLGTQAVLNVHYNCHFVSELLAVCSNFVL